MWTASFRGGACTWCCALRHICLSFRHTLRGTQCLAINCSQAIISPHQEDCAQPLYTHHAQVHAASTHKPLCLVNPGLLSGKRCCWRMTTGFAEIALEASQADACPKSTDGGHSCWIVMHVIKPLPDRVSQAVAGANVWRMTLISCMQS